MAEPYVGQISYFGCNFAPQNWAFCNGQLLSISQFTALFSILGTTYGGNGTTNFALPNMQGCVPMHWGNGAGLTPRALGEEGGAENTSLTTQTLGSHTHSLVATTTKATTVTPVDSADILGRSVALTQLPLVYVSAAPNTFKPLNVAAISPTPSGSLPFALLQPTLVVNCCIALQGVFPARN